MHGAGVVRQWRTGNWLVWQACSFYPVILTVNEVLLQMFGSSPYTDVQKWPELQVSQNKALPARFHFQQLLRWRSFNDSESQRLSLFSLGHVIRPVQLAKAANRQQQSGNQQPGSRNKKEPVKLTLAIWAIFCLKELSSFNLGSLNLTIWI